jgi:hypothetical protein
MLYPAMVLAAFCIIWGFGQPLVASFMHVPLETTLLGSFLSLETPIFLALLLPTGLIIYYAYYKNNLAMRVAASRSPLAKVLSHGYFFDDLYYAVARGIAGFSEGLGKLEDVGSLFPQKFALSVVRFANGVHTYFDVLVDQFINVAANRSLKGAGEIQKFDSLLDKFLNLLGNKSLSGAKQIKKTPSTSLQHYVAAAVLGFILIVILIILTLGV